MGEAPARRLVVASRNAAKVAAIGRVVPAGWTAVSAPAAVGAVEEDEAGSSFAEVARDKARRASTRLPGKLVVASDGGLLVPALGGTWDPLRTRRFAGAAATDGERAAALLRLASGLAGEGRRIGWREALAVARGGTVLAAWEAEDPGGLLADDYGPDLLADAGFWLPALWICPEFGGRRLAELSGAERAARDDHWTRLGREVRRFLGRSVAARGHRS